MSLSCLLRGRVCGNYINSFLKQNHFAWGSCRHLAPPLAQCATQIGTINYSTTATTKSATDDTKWTTVYRFPLIRLAAGFNRLKVYQGILTAVAVPFTFTMTELGHFSPGVLYTVGAVGATGLLTLTLASFFVRNVIGFVYINKEGDTVKLAYVDFWGKRQNKIVALDDLDMDFEKTFMFYKPVRVHSNTYKLLHNYGVVVESEIFAAIFGF